MPLDLAALAPQIQQLGGALREQPPREDRALHDGLAVLRRVAGELAWLRERLAGTGTSWLCAWPTEPLDRVYPLPPCPPALTVLGSDGSQIPPNPHDPVLCYVLNVGLVALTYGPAPRATLRSVPHLAHTDAELFVAIGGQRLLVEGDNLAVRRGARELEGLVVLADEVLAGGPAGPVVALRDGTLIEWTLQRGQDEEARERLYEPFVAALAALRDRGVPVASYISRPRSPYVLNMLRVALCDEGATRCATICGALAIDHAPTAPLCSRLRGLADRQLFEALPLADGERSALFKRAGKGSWRQVEAAANVHFFYVNVGAEIARVEVPDWVAADRAALDLVHTAVVDQCRRGDGYPPVLAEAHEQAVLGGGDRERFETLLAAALARLGVERQPSAKGISKRRPGL